MRLALIVLALTGGLMAMDTIADSFPYAIAGRGCTQEDAPALEIYLTRQSFGGSDAPAPPFIRVEVAWGDWTRAGGQEMSLVPLSRRGSDPRQPLARAELDQESTAPIWLRGTIRLTAVEPGRRVTGSYTVTVPDGREWSGSFDAHWLDRRPVCG